MHYPLNLQYRSNPATGVAVYNVIKFIFVILALEPIESLLLNAVITKPYGEFVLPICMTWCANVVAVVAFHQSIV